MDKLLQQVGSLDIPYPQRHWLALEIRFDLDFDDAEQRRDGMLLLESDVNELRAIHSTWLHRLLCGFGQARRVVEITSAFFPLGVALTFLAKEDTVMDFIQEGGIGMYAILGLGIFLLGKEILNVIRLIVIKDHSSANLQVDTASVLLGCLAMMLLSVGSTALGVYVSANSLTQFHSSYDRLLAGANESLTNLVLSSFLCALIVLVHYGTRHTLKAWHAPLN